MRQIGRLDLDTSGIVLFALDPVTAQRLWKQGRGQLVKTYYALCARQDGTGIRTDYLPLGKEPGCKNQMCVLPKGEGLSAETLYALLWEKKLSEEYISCVSCHLKTGRTPTRSVCIFLQQHIRCLAIKFMVKKMGQNG